MQFEKANPCFRERHAESSRRSGGGRAPQRRLTLLPGRGLPVTAVLSDNGRELCGTNSHPTKSIWLSTTSSIGARECADARPTALSSASTARCWTSSFAQPFAPLLQDGRGFAGGPGRLAGALQHRASASRLSQHGQTPDRDYSVILGKCSPRSPVVHVKDSSSIARNLSEFSSMIWTIC